MPKNYVRKIKQKWIKVNMQNAISEVLQGKGSRRKIASKIHKQVFYVIMIKTSLSGKIDVALQSKARFQSGN